MTDVRVSAVPNEAGPCVVRVPGSKSVANRALVCAALATGRSRLTGLPTGDDTRLLIAALRSLGLAVSIHGRETTIDGPLPGESLAATVDAGLGGTTARFLTAVAALRGSPTTITARGRLLQRPMEPLVEALRTLGARVELGSHGGVVAVVSGGALGGGDVNISSSESSQFVSALMMIGPMMAAGLRITLEGPQMSRPYIEMTARVMRRFGGDVETTTDRIVVRPGRYSPIDLAIEADYSSAAYPALASALTGRPVLIADLTEDSVQGDARLVEIIRSMNCRAEFTTEGLSISPEAGARFPGRNLDLAHESDLVPPIAVALLGATSPSSIRGVGFIRAKESNRLDDLAEELRKTGATVRATEDGLTIEPASLLGEATLEPHDDHRLAMSYALLPLVAARGAGAAHEISITVPSSECVAKSWPSYWEDMSPFCRVESLPS